MSKTFNFFRLYIIFFTSYDNNHLSTNNNIYSNMHIIHNSISIQKILTKLQYHFYLSSNMDVLANAIKRQNSSNKYPSPVLYERSQPVITLTSILHTDFSSC